jgi:hypothetical protein
MATPVQAREAPPASPAGLFCVCLQHSRFAPYFGVVPFAADGFFSFLPAGGFAVVVAGVAPSSAASARRSGLDQGR